MPGMWSSTARPSGRGRRRSGNAGTGIVDHRFDHIDSGWLVATGARAYFRRPSVTCTSRPHTPVSAQSRTEVGAPSSSGTSEWPWVRCGTVDAEHVGKRREQVDGGGERVDDAGVDARATRRAAACGRAARRPAPRACPRCPSRRGSGRGRCTRSPRCRPSGPCGRARRGPDRTSGRSSRASPRSWPGSGARRRSSSTPFADRVDRVRRPDQPRPRRRRRCRSATPTARACRTARAGRTRRRTGRSARRSAPRCSSHCAAAAIVRGPGKSASSRNQVRDWS